MNVPLYVALIALCVLFSAYFSATETAFSSLNKTRLKTMIEKGNKKAELAYSLSENYDKLISTILIGNNIVNIAGASLGTVLFVHIYGDIGATISTAVITVAVLIFGEISPKSIAKDCPERFAMFSSPLIKMLIFVCTPLNFLFTLWKRLLSRVLHLEESTGMSSEELIMLVEEVQQEGTIDDDESDLIKNAIEFNDRKAEDILTHRVDLEAVPNDAEKMEIAKVFSETKFSRLLVYEENIDNIVGVINQKDFYVEGGITKKAIKDITTPPLFIQKSEKINDLLKILQKHKSHIAVVVDEYGGTLGIVTMEDILEELVGEIWDEHDEVEEEFVEISETTFSVDGSYNLEDFCQHFDIEIEETDSISVGGWAMEMLGKVPDKDDTFSYENLVLTVSEIDSHRVTRIRVEIVELEENESEKED